MLALPDLQKAFAGYLSGGDGVDLARIVRGDSISAAARLRIHRHHVQQSLATALAATFPTVHTLVGEAFFGAMAGSFVVKDLPTQPVLAEYGAAFPDFVDGYAPARDLPYLPDMARLDWALNVAFHSPDGPRLAAADLDSIAPDRLLGLALDLTPGSALVPSAFPIDRIWQASQPGANGSQVDLAAAGASLLVGRRSDDAAFVALDAAEAAFVTAILGRATLEAAAQAAFAVEPAFDLSTSFGRLLALQAFAALR
ncbi:MAG: DUF2063 domain-containing protein [Reyranella sp.]|nr:MAG: DUF2063 domain-containing protein [Reyranella sp.]